MQQVRTDRAAGDAEFPKPRAGRSEAHCASLAAQLEEAALERAKAAVLPSDVLPATPSPLSAGLTLRVQPEEAAGEEVKPAAEHGQAAFGFKASASPRPSVGAHGEENPGQLQSAPRHVTSQLVKVGTLAAAMLAWRFPRACGPLLCFHAARILRMQEVNLISEKLEDLDSRTRTMQHFAGAMTPMKESLQMLNRIALLEQELAGIDKRCVADARRKRALASVSNQVAPKADKQALLSIRLDLLGQGTCIAAPAAWFSCLGYTKAVQQAQGHRIMALNSQTIRRFSLGAWAGE